MLYVHGCDENVRNLCGFCEQEQEAVAKIASFETSFLRSSGYIEAPLWSKASALLTSARLLSLSSGLRGYSDPFCRIWVIQFQLGWCANRWDRVSLLRNSELYPTVESCCDSNNPALVHQHQVVLLGSLVRESKGEFGRGWLSWGDLHDGLDDVNQIGQPSVLAC